MATTSAPVALTYRTIRRDYQSHYVIEPVLVDHYAKLLSPFLTPFFVRFGIIPNVVTVFMMVSGIIGAAFFALPPLWAKIAGLVFIHLWYVLDCCDGEVARITRRFSRMGTEIDYTAHLINHPLFNLAFALSLIQLHRYSTTLILFIAIGSISAELMLRNLLTLSHIHALKLGAPISQDRKAGPVKAFANLVTNLLHLYPNFALIFPPAFVLDNYLGTTISFWLLLLQLAASSLVVAKTTTKWIRVITWT